MKKFQGNNKYWLLGLFAIFIVGLCTFSVAFDINYSPNWDGRTYWDGHGYSEPCIDGAHWVLSGEGLNITSAFLTVGNWNGDMQQNGRGSWAADSIGYVDNNTVVYADYNGNLGDGFIKLSHCNCPSTQTPTETFVPTITNTPTLIITNTPTEPITDTPTEPITNTPTATTTKTSTPTETNTSTQTPTETLNPSPTSTETYTPTQTPTGTLTPSPTPVDSYTPTSTYIPTGTNIPTDTNTPTSTNTPTDTNTPTTTNMPTSIITVIPTFTATFVPTETPKPPKPGIADSAMRVDYPGKTIGIIYVQNDSYLLYAGVNAPDGSLMLPNKVKGGALYNNQIWIHRAWNSGWLNFKIGDNVTIIQNNGKINIYTITNSAYQPYGKYFDDGKLHIITCYGEKRWEGVQVFDLKLIWKEQINAYR